MKTAIDSPRADVYGTKSKSFSIKQDRKAFRAFSDGLYSNKPEAIVRELSSNAVDAHRDAGKSDKPFTIFLPCDDNPRFVIRDYGTGLSLKEIEEIYTVYGESTKDHSNDDIGGFGLGSKTPFAYTDQFFVRSYYEGTLYTFTFYFSEDEPNWALISEDPTDEDNGLEIYFDVDDVDYRLFHNAAQNIIPWFRTPVQVYSMSSEKNGFFETSADSVDLSNKYQEDFEKTIVYEDSDMLVMREPVRYNQGRISVLQGGVHYEIGNGMNEMFESEDPTLRAFKKLIRSSFVYQREKNAGYQTGQMYYVLKFPIGTLDLARSREVVSWTRNHSIPNARKKLREITQNGLTQFLDEIKKAKSTLAKSRLWVNNVEGHGISRQLESLHLYLGGSAFSELLQYKTGDDLQIKYLKTLLGDKEIQNFHAQNKSLTDARQGLKYKFDVFSIERLNKGLKDEWVKSVRVYNFRQTATGNIVNTRVDAGFDISNNNEYYSVNPYGGRPFRIIIHNNRVLNLKIYTELYPNSMGGSPSIHVDCKNKISHKEINKNLIPKILKQIGARKDDVEIIISGNLTESELKKSSSYVDKTTTTKGECIHTTLNLYSPSRQRGATANDIIRRAIIQPTEEQYWIKQERDLANLAGQHLVYALKKYDRTQIEVHSGEKNPDGSYESTIQELDRGPLLRNIIIWHLRKSKTLREFEDSFKNIKFVIISKNDLKKVKSVTKSMTPIEDYIVDMSKDNQIKNIYINQAIELYHKITPLLQLWDDYHSLESTFRKSSNLDQIPITAIKTIHNVEVDSIEQEIQKVQKLINDCAIQLVKQPRNRLVLEVLRNIGRNSFSHSSFTYNNIMNAINNKKYDETNFEPFLVIVQKKMEGLNNVGRIIPQHCGSSDGKLHLTHELHGGKMSVFGQPGQEVSSSISGLRAEIQNISEQCSKFQEALNQHPILMSLDIDKLQKNLSNQSQPEVDDLDSFMLQLGRAELSLKNQQDHQTDQEEQNDEQ